MGNIINLEVPINFDLSPEPEPPSSLPSILILLFAFFAGALFACLAIFIYRKFRLAFPNIFARPSILIFSVLIILSILPSPVETRPKGKFVRKANIAKKLPLAVARHFGKSALPLLATTAFYLGFESLAAQLEENPDTASVLLYFLGFFAALIALFIVKFAFSLYLHFYPPRPQNRVAPSPEIELGEIRNAVEELVQRTDPPRHH